MNPAATPRLMPAAGYSAATDVHPSCDPWQRPIQFFPAPHTPAADDGQPGIPSSDAASAKSDGLVPLVERAGAQPGHESRESERAVASFPSLAPGSGRSAIPYQAAPSALFASAIERRAARFCNLGRFTAGTVFRTLVQAAKQASCVLNVVFSPPLAVVHVEQHSERTGQSVVKRGQ